MRGGAEADRGKALAGKSTLNRLELTSEKADAGSRYKKIVADWEAMDKLLVEVFLESDGLPPREIVIDVDATYDPLHGHQEGRFFHGYYGHYCYLPLYLFCGDKFLGARLREADEDPAAGCIEELARGGGAISGACRPSGGSFCAGIADFAARRSCIGVRPRGSIMCWGWRRIAVSSKPLPRSWQKPSASMRAPAGRRGCSGISVTKPWRVGLPDRPVVGKAEYLAKGENPRFIVTSLSRQEQDA